MKIDAGVDNGNANAGISHPVRPGLRQINVCILLTLPLTRVMQAPGTLKIEIIRKDALFQFDDVIWLHEPYPLIHRQLPLNRSLWPVCRDLNHHPILQGAGRRSMSWPLGLVERGDQSLTNHFRVLLMHALYPGSGVLSHSHQVGARDHLIGPLSQPSRTRNQENTYWEHPRQNRQKEPGQKSL